MSVGDDLEELRALRVSDGMCNPRRDIRMPRLAQHADAGQLRFRILAFQRDVQLRP